MRAKKSYGQHFLHNEGIAEDIVNGLSGKGYQCIIEVGPGKGVLTKHLLALPFKFYAVEADDDLTDYLQFELPNIKDKLISGNILKTDLSNLSNKEQIAIIGNFPYNISSQIVFKMLDDKEYIIEMVGMFQKEMAERIIANHGSKTYGVISVLTQAYYNGEYLFSVGNENFSPAPKVQSGVIRLRRKRASLDVNERLFKVIVKMAFGQRRKMMRNSLKSLLKENEVPDNEFFNLRPEQISVESFLELTALIDSHIKMKDKDEP